MKQLMKCEFFYNMKIKRNLTMFRPITYRMALRGILVHIKNINSNTVQVITIHTMGEIIYNVTWEKLVKIVTILEQNYYQQTNY